eukprot:10660062-Alexandrium_andersonii.AAC.1
MASGAAAAAAAARPAEGMRQESMGAPPHHEMPGERARATRSKHQTLPNHVDAREGPGTAKQQTRGRRRS